MLELAFKKNRLISYIQNCDFLEKSEKRALVSRAKESVLDLDRELIIALIEHGVVKAGGRVVFSDCILDLPLTFYLSCLLEGFPASTDLSPLIYAALQDDSDLYLEDFRLKELEILNLDMILDISRTGKTFKVLSLRRKEENEVRQDQLKKLAEAFDVLDEDESKGKSSTPEAGLGERPEDSIQVGNLVSLFTYFYDLEVSFCSVQDLSKERFTNLVSGLIMFKSLVTEFADRLIADRKTQILMGSSLIRITGDLDASVSFFGEGDTAEAHHRLTVVLRDFKLILASFRYMI